MIHMDAESPSTFRGGCQKRFWWTGDHKSVSSLQRLECLRIHREQSCLYTMFQRSWQARKNLWASFSTLTNGHLLDLSCLLTFSVLIWHIKLWFSFGRSSSIVLMVNTTQGINKKIPLPFEQLAQVVVSESIVQTQFQPSAIPN